MAIVIKTPEQIEGIRKSSHLAAETLKYMEQFVKPGVKTIELDKIIEDFVRSKGATPATKGTEALNTLHASLPMMLFAMEFLMIRFWLMVIL